MKMLLPLFLAALLQAACSKGDQAQPDRTITLERQAGARTVINEGY